MAAFSYEADDARQMLHDQSRLLAVTCVDEESGEAADAAPERVEEAAAAGEPGSDTLALEPRRVAELRALQETTCAPPRPVTSLRPHSRPPSLTNLQDAAALLANFNRFSATKLSSAGQVYARSTQLVQEVTADLHHIFKRTRALQKRISDSHPAAWATVGQRPLFGEAD
jgi:Uncharacterized conserved protein